VSKKAGICTLMINRPEKRNALTEEITARLQMELRAAAEDGETKVVVLRGAGEKAFSAGYDISRLDTGEGEIGDPLEDVLQAIENTPMPVIAMIHGYCIGGACGLAMACDLRLAAEDARLGITAARLGVLYPPSATRLLVQLVGVASAKELLFTGRLIDAGRAKDIRLVDRVVPGDRLADVTYELAREIAANSPSSVRGIKRIIAKLLAYPSTAPARQEFVEIQQQAAARFDREEGQQAFLEKRPPVFKKKI
jgi:enoyl-CoA hydratase